MYVKFHQNQRGKGLTNWVIWHGMTQMPLLHHKGFAPAPADRTYRGEGEIDKP